MDTFSFIDLVYFSDLLEVGTLGFLGGVLLPWVFRLTGYVVDVVTMIVR